MIESNDQQLLEDCEENDIARWGELAVFSAAFCVASVAKDELAGEDAWLRITDDRLRWALEELVAVCRFGEQLFEPEETQEV